MERRNFMKMAGTLALTSVLKSSASSLPATTPGKEIYEWRIYTLTDKPDVLDDFYRNVLIPFYNRKGIKAGAFADWKPQEKSLRYYLFIYPDLATYHHLRNAIWEDSVFRSDAQHFFDMTASSPIYSNFETYLCEAFQKIPVHRLPDPERSLFEIRLYWSPNVEANQRKIGMFNKGEIDIFDKVGINSVCYGDILAGPRMPALIYLTWYKDEPTRAEAWKKFGSHPDWLHIKDLPEYSYTATNNRSILLSPLPYSQL